MTPVNKHDGKRKEDDIENFCKQCSMDNTQLATSGFDDQYFNLRVPNKLRDKLFLDQNLVLIWDPTDHLQLADKDAHKHCPWTHETGRDNTAILLMF